MGRKARRPDDVGDITGPPTPPPVQADSYTADEIGRLQRAAKKTTPTEAHRAATDRHLDEICSQLDRVRSERDHLQRELDRLRPEHARLDEAFRGALASNGFSTAMLGLGGTILSLAGFITSDPWKVFGVTVGAVTFAWGFVFQVSSTWRSVVFRPTASPVNALMPPHAIAPLPSGGGASSS